MVTTALSRLILIMKQDQSREKKFLVFDGNSKLSDVVKKISGPYKDMYQKLADAGFDNLTHMKNYYNKASAGLWNTRTDEQKHRYLLSVLSDPSVSADSQDLLNALKEKIVKDYKHNKTLKNPEPIAKEDYKYRRMNKGAFDDLVTSYLASDPKFSIHPSEQWIDKDYQKIFDEYIDREWKRELDKLEQAICPGYSCTLGTNCVCFKCADVPQTPLPYGIIPQATGP